MSKKKIQDGSESRDIIISGAAVNNLKDVDVTVPRGKFVVITGVSGSGKSSLAFDTLYAEGQRRYVESLSSYARQFMGKMHKPECKSITGLPPAIAIEQKVNTRNPRSTVGTSTEIYDYIRLLFGRVGHTFSPVSGDEVKKHTVDDVVARALSYPAGTRIAVAAPAHLPDGRKVRSQLDVYFKAGYSRLIKDGEFLDIEEMLADDKLVPESLDGYDLLIDRLAVTDEQDEISRLADSVEAAFFEGDSAMNLMAWVDGEVVTTPFSKKFEADGIKFSEPSDMMFNFNNPVGACDTCGGFGKVLGIDPRLVVPNPSLSVYDDAVACWKGDKMSEWKREFISRASSRNFPVHAPYVDLTPEQVALLWHGDGTKSFPSIDNFFRMVEENQYKIQYRVMYARYRGKAECPVCHGSRLKEAASYVKVGGLTIGEIVKMPVDQLLQWFEDLRLDEHDSKIASRLLTEIRNRLGYLVEVGLGYLTLDRLSSTLSGGESQRINLATSLGSSLVGSLYILDEPSIGLHSRDTDRLISVLRKLRDAGNTVVVVEHDEEIMRAADYIIDVGPDAGRLGGKIVFQGTPDHLPESDGYTAKYLTGKLSIPLPESRRKWRDKITVNGARENNLRGIDVDFPLGVMTVVSGVSGSGKSTLVRDILYRGLLRHLGEASDAPGAFRALTGDLSRISAVEFVDQNPIGKSSRSNPATYLKAFDEIRKLYASQQAAVQLGLTPGDFSFNAEGGRCEECKGEGYITIEMQSMADITIPCESGHGMRYTRDVLDVLY
ncbi:MAG: excinuclease ABC subunit UvrA, partial [Duncaniella sp.]|nr:excinuclease ABC subunit UvrA [Duncaniella sp.]